MIRENNTMNKKFKFIDLFSGIGAFHQAMVSLGGECVFASDIDKWAIQTYQENYNMDSAYNICTTKEEDIPAHDVLCGGFPCQAFSNAGHKRGFEDTRGTLFFEIARILRYHKTRFIVLENVKHLVGHDNGRTWEVIRETLVELGYVLTETPILMSPHYIGIPQNRERVFILGVHQDELANNDQIKTYQTPEGVRYLDIQHPTKNDAPETSIYSVLDALTGAEYDKYRITPYEERIFNAWDEFHSTIEEKVYGVPIWFDEFGLTYDYSDLPDWKQHYIRKNRKIYLDNKEFIDKWAAKWGVKNFKLRDRKFEWQAGEAYDTIWETSIQLRQSGIRCKKTDYFPTLVAMVQTPIVGRLRRRITPREAARLQSFPENFIINSNEQKAFKQFGNSANVEIIKILASQIVKI